MEFETIDYPNSISTALTGINDSGDVVGYYNGTYGFLYERGAFTTYNVPGANRTNIRGINNRGDIVGVYLDGVRSDEHGFILRNGELTSIDYPNSSNTRVWGINDTGTIIGIGNFQINFAWRDGVFHVQTIPYHSVVTGINNLGDVVGQFHDGVTDHGFIMKDDEFVVIDFPNAQRTQVWGLNDRGQIVGTYFDGLWHGFLYDNGAFFTIDHPNSQDSTLFGINNRGDVVGEYSDGQRAHGFMARTHRLISGK